MQIKNFRIQDPQDRTQKIRIQDPQDSTQNDNFRIQASQDLMQKTKLQDPGSPESYTKTRFQDPRSHRIPEYPTIKSLDRKSLLKDSLVPYLTQSQFTITNKPDIRTLNHSSSVPSKFILRITYHSSSVYFP